MLSCSGKFSFQSFFSSYYPYQLHSFMLHTIDSWCCDDFIHLYQQHVLLDYRFGSQLVKKGEIDFLQLMTSIFTIMFGAMGLGTAVSDLGDQQEGIIAAKSILETIEQGLFSSIVSVIMLLLVDDDDGVMMISPLHSTVSMYVSV